MTKPTKRQLQEESLEKKFGIPAIGLTLVTIVFYIATTKSLFPFESRELGSIFGILATVATIAIITNVIGAFKIKFGFLRWIMIVSAVICALIAGWTLLVKQLLAP